MALHFKPLLIAAVLAAGCTVPLVKAGASAPYSTTNAIDATAIRHVVGEPPHGSLVDLAPLSGNRIGAGIAPDQAPIAVAPAASRGFIIPVKGE